MKITSIDMDWTNTGARVLSSLAIPCPACGQVVTPNVEHLCGDRAPKAASRSPRKVSEPKPRV